MNYESGCGGLRGLSDFDGGEGNPAPFLGQSESSKESSVTVKYQSKYGLVW